MSLFGGDDDGLNQSGLFGNLNTEELNAGAPDLDSPDDLGGQENFKKVSRLAVSGLVFVVLIVGVLFLFGRGSSNPTTPPEPATGAIDVTTGSSDADSSSSILGDWIHSVVLIVVGTQDEFCASGSGFAVGDGSIIVTNNHVIQSSPECKVELIAIFVTTDPSEKPKMTFEGKVISKDPATDLAVLSITDREGKPGTLQPLQLSTEKVEVGQALQIIGYPGIGGFTVTVTQGNVAGFTSDETGRWIKTDASISGGNSGGVAIDSDGRVVGVPTQAGGGGSTVVDCREFDTNNDGVINSKDSCVPIGGFLNLLRPADYVIQAIRQSQ